MLIDAQGMDYRELNGRIEEVVASGDTAIELANVNGQRYIADGILSDARIEIHGIPGNDLGAFMDGPTVVVHGNAQDGIGNTMNGGKIVVHGDAVYLRGNWDRSHVAGSHVDVRDADDEDLQQVRPALQEFGGDFGLEMDIILDESFSKLTPLSHRPYDAKYAA